MRVNIHIYYNGGWPKAHTVSRGFLDRLKKWIDQRPYLDVIIVELGEASDPSPSSSDDQANRQ